MNDWQLSAPTEDHSVILKCLCSMTISGQFHTRSGSVHDHAELRANHGKHMWVYKIWSFKSNG